MRKIVPFNNVLTFDTDVNEITAISLEHNLVKEADAISGVFYISGEYKILNGGLNQEKFNFELPFDIALGTRYQMDSLLVDIDDFRYELVEENKMKVNIDLYIDGEEAPIESIEVNEEPVEVIETPLADIREENNEEKVEDTNELNNDDNDIYEEKEVIDDNDMIEEGEIDMNNQNDEVNYMDNIKDTMENDIKRESDLVKEFIYNQEEDEGINLSSNNIENDNDNDNNILNNLNDEENYVTYKVYRVVDGDTIDSILTKYKVTKEELLCYNENITEVKVGDKLIIPFK